MVYFYLTARMLWRWVAAVHLPAPICSFTQWAFLHSALSLVPTLCCTHALTAGNEGNQDAREVGAWSSLQPKENVTIAVFYPGHSRKQRAFCFHHTFSNGPVEYFISSIRWNDSQLTASFQIQTILRSIRMVTCCSLFSCNEEVCNSTKLTWMLRTDYQISCLKKVCRCNVFHCGLSFPKKMSDDPLPNRI